MQEMKNKCCLICLIYSISLNLQGKGKIIELKILRSAKGFKYIQRARGKCPNIPNNHLLIARPNQSTINTKLQQIE